VALESIPTFTLVFARFFLAAIIFLIIRQGRKWPVFKRKDHVKIGKRSQVPESRASVFVNGIPVVTAIGAWVCLDERLTAIQPGGGALVLAAVFLTHLPGKMVN
jgi:drug/metabolite transporter (DMT)-like permease